MSIGENVEKIMGRIELAARKAGRDPGEITLCAATKMNDAHAVRQAIRAGIRCCGENRVQELVRKSAENAYDGADVHFIGHLQTNKVRQVVGKVSLIQSIDSLHLLEAVNAEAQRQEIVQDILLEVNIGAEESKHGFSPEELPRILENAGNCKGIFVRGLMAIPPICHFAEENDTFFQKMYHISVDIGRKKYDNICSDILSMGMSGDFERAIAFGATMVRVGTAIFGPRDQGTAP